MAKDKSEDAGKTEKAGKAEKAEKADRAEKAPKGERPAKGEKGQKGKGGRGAEAGGREPEVVEEKIPYGEPRKRELYRTAVVPALMKQFSYRSVMQVPRLRKIVLNMGLGAAVANPKIIESAQDELRAITGQRPIVTRAKKAISNFKIRHGLAIGAMVTLRHHRMWEFFDRFVSLALPRMRDFKGVSPRGFDGRGSYTLGLKEQIIFPEINYDRVDAIKGLNITLVTTARTDDEGRALLAQLGMPFRA